MVRKLIVKVTAIVQLFVHTIYVCTCTLTFNYQADRGGRPKIEVIGEWYTAVMWSCGHVILPCHVI